MVPRSGFLGGGGAAPDIENHGVEPHLVVELVPGATGDAQLDAATDAALDALGSRGPDAAATELGKWEPIQRRQPHWSGTFS